jgi:ribosomal protein L13
MENTMKIKIIDEPDRDMGKIITKMAKTIMAKKFPMYNIIYDNGYVCVTDSEATATTIKRLCKDLGDIKEIIEIYQDGFHQGRNYEYIKCY